MELELPNLEDIYDFNETLLRSWLDKVDTAFNNSALPKEEKWDRKARRVKELIEIEIDERISINQISMFCFKELSSDFYKEVVQDIEPTVTTQASSDVIETQQEQETGLKLWNNRKKTKGKDYMMKIRETLKNTEISSGLVVGSSSVKQSQKTQSNRSRNLTKGKEEEKKVIKETKVLPKNTNLERTRTHSKSRNTSKPKSEIRQTASHRHDEIKAANTTKERINKGSKLNTEGTMSCRVPGTDFKAKQLRETPSESTKSTPGKSAASRQSKTPQADSQQLFQAPEISHSYQESPVKVPQEVHSDILIPVETVYVIQATQELHTECEESTEKLQDLSSSVNTDFTQDTIQEISINTELQKDQLVIYDDFEIENTGREGEESENTDIENPSINTEHDMNLYSAAQIEISHKIDTESYYETDQSVVITSRKVESLYELITPSNQSDSLLDLDRSSIPSTSKAKDFTFTPDAHSLRQAKQKLLEYTSKSNTPELPSRVRAIIQEKQNQPKLPISTSETPSKTPIESPHIKPLVKKPPLPKQILPKPKPQSEINPNAFDYTQYYKYFSDLFCGSDTKEFNYLNTLREAILVFKEFNSIIDSPEFELQKKFKLSVAPLEINPRDLLNKDISSIMQPRTLCDNEMYYRVVRARAEVYDIVTRSFTKKKSWTELPHGMNLRHSWNVMWTWSKPTVDFTKLLVWQKVNHFPNTKNFSRKDLLKRNIEKMMKISNKCATVWNIIPDTYILPKEYIQFVEEYTNMSEKCPQENVWIMKPVGKSRGRGISMINDLSQVSYGEPMVIQKYLYRPLLLGGFKFDLRIYVLITAFNPLEVFLYKEGFARLSTVPYSTQPDKLLNKYIHLTNSSIQKHNCNPATDSVDYIFGGTKISLKSLRDRLLGDNISFDKIWQQIREIIIKSLIAVQSEIPSMNCCFDLVGFDIMIDTNLQAWLIEINSSPSLARENVLDDMIKQQLVDDTLDLVDPVFFNRLELVKVLERRMNEVQKGQNINSTQQLNSDLTRILEGRRPRMYGEEPKKMGNYEMIAPSPIHEKYYKLAYPRS